MNTKGKIRYTNLIKLDTQIFFEKKKRECEKEREQKNKTDRN
jgi:hypothetical protein